jgi:hypothetical protein
MVYAHQGGWDEILLVLVPVVVIFSLLRLAKHRAMQARAAREASAAADAPPGQL